MSTIAKKKSIIEEKKKGHKHSMGKKIGSFMKYLGIIVGILAALFIISPPLFYTFQFVNSYILKEKMEYDGYDNYDTYFKEQIEFPPVKKGVPTLPINQRPLAENITEAFKASLANSFFMSRDILSGIIGLSKKFLDFNYTLDENLFKKDASVSKILEVMTNINNERKPNGVLGQIIGTFVILLSPLVYLLLLGLPTLSFLSGLFTLFTTLNMRTYIKILAMIGVCIAAYLSSYIMLFIPSIFFLFIPQLAAGWIMFITGIVIACLVVGIPSLFMIVSSLITTIKTLSSMLWVPEFVNKIFMSKMTTGQKNSYENIRLRGTRDEYPAHAREFSGLYLSLFLISTISVGISVVFS